MEHFDHQLAARVWQRVQENRPPVRLPEQVPGFLQEELSDLNLYRQLSVQLPGHKSQLQQLAAITRQCAAILRGILFLMDAQPEAVAFPKPKELPGAALRRSYRNTLLRLEQYRQQEAHPEYAPGFSALAQNSQNRCRLLLEILGGL